MKSTLLLLISIILILFAVIFEDIFISSVLYGFGITFILLIFAIGLYTFSVITIIIGWKSYENKRRSIEIMLHVFFIIVLSGYIISKTELVKSTPIIIAETNHINTYYRLILRKNGYCEYQHLTIDNRLLWEYKGKYIITGDTIKMDILPYNLYINENQIWYLDVKENDYNVMDTILMNIIPIGFK